MKYEQKSFSVQMGGEKYADNWDRIFGKKKTACDEHGSHIWSYGNDGFKCDDCGAEVEVGDTVAVEIK